MTPKPPNTSVGTTKMLPMDLPKFPIRSEFVVICT